MEWGEGEKVKRGLAGWGPESFAFKHFANGLVYELGDIPETLLLLEALARLDKDIAHSDELSPSPLRRVVG